jgi:hypothetical protein
VLETRYFCGSFAPHHAATGGTVTVTIHPLKDSSRGGPFITAMLPNRTMQKPSATGE